MGFDFNSFDHVNEVIYEQTYKTRDLEIPGLHLVSEEAEGTKVWQNTWNPFMATP